MSSGLYRLFLGQLLLYRHFDSFDAAVNALFLENIGNMELDCAQAYVVPFDDSLSRPGIAMRKIKGGPNGLIDLDNIDREGLTSLPGHS